MTFRIGEQDYQLIKQYYSDCNILLVNTTDDLYRYASVSTLFILDSYVWSLPTINYTKLMENGSKIITIGNDNSPDRIPLISSGQYASYGTYNESYELPIYTTILTPFDKIYALTNDYLYVVTNWSDGVIPLTRNDRYDLTMIGLYEDNNVVWIHSQVPSYRNYLHIVVPYIIGFHLYDYEHTFGIYEFCNRTYFYIANITIDITNTNSIDVIFYNGHLIVNGRTYDVPHFLHVLSITRTADIIKPKVFIISYDKILVNGVL